MPIFLFALITLGLVFLAFGAMLKKNSLPRNGAIGIRTRATQSSDEAWTAGHLAAAPLLRWAGVISLCFAVASILGWLFLDTRFGNIVSIAGLVTVLILLVKVTSSANKAARETDL